MTFQALLVSTDEEATATLTPVLAEFGVGVTSCGYADVSVRLGHQKFDAVIVDYDDPVQASATLQKASPNGSRNAPVSVALLGDKSRVRSVFGAGAHFVLYKPVSSQQAQSGLRAAAALIKRERRRSFRVPVQLPVRLQLGDNTELEGILLDLSEDGMDVLAAQPLCPSEPITCRVNLLDNSGELAFNGEVAWANPNGQSGVRFVDLSKDSQQVLKWWVTNNAPELPPEDPEPVTQCKLSDLSLGGCYVETESPFPERSAIVLTLEAGHLEVQAEGVVRVMHPGFGMGIEFASRTEEQRQKVAEFIEQLTSTPGSSPKLRITPRALLSDLSIDATTPPTEDSGDALLDLLHNHKSMSQEEFLRALHEQRNSEEAVPS